MIIKVVRTLTALVALTLIVLGLTTITPELDEGLPEALCDAAIGILTTVGGLVLWCTATLSPTSQDKEREEEERGSPDEL